MKEKRKIVYWFFLVMILVTLTTGCGSTTKINTSSRLVEAKKVMVDELKNFRYDITVKLVSDLGNFDVTVNCQEDRQNEIGYCESNSYGIKTEGYTDYKNNMEYIKVTTSLDTDLFGNGKWQNSKIESSNTNEWLKLSDYVTDVKEESKDGGVYYQGVIDTKKLLEAMSTIDNSTSGSDLTTDMIKDINTEIKVFVNASGYMETMTFTLKVMGIEEVVEVRYKDYNQAGSITIPEEAKG